MARTASVCHSACVNADSALKWTLAKVDPSGRRDEFTVRVSVPRYAREPFPGWRCALVVEGHPGGEIVIVGATAMQAMSLALKVARDILRGIAADAALIEVETLESITLETLSEGAH